MDQLKLYSTVLSRVKKRLLFRGLTLALCGALLLSTMGVWAPLSVLEVWGLPTFCLGIFLIGWGLIPYRKLTRLETHPHQLIIDETSLTFLASRGGVRTYHLSEIKQMNYWESKTRYGLQLELESGRVFLPHFLRNSSLDEIVHPNQTDQRS